MSVEVEQGSWQRHKRDGYPEDFVIMGLGPCTGVMAVCADLGIAYGTHLTSPHQHETEELDEMLNEAAAELARGVGTEITIAGCCERQNPDWRAVRTFVEERVRTALPKATVRVRWPEPDVDSVNMIVDAVTGICHLENNKKQAPVP